jgi:hypothetical protein
VRNKKRDENSSATYKLTVLFHLQSFAVEVNAGLVGVRFFSDFNSAVQYTACPLQLTFLASTTTKIKLNKSK